MEMIKAWCKIGAKYKWEIPSPMKGSGKSAIVPFIDGADKGISIFQLEVMFFYITFGYISHLVQVNASWTNFLCVMFMFA